MPKMISQSKSRPEWIIAMVVMMIAMSIVKLARKVVIMIAISIVQLARKNAKFTLEIIAANPKMLIVLLQ